MTAMLWAQVAEGGRMSPMLWVVVSVAVFGLIWALAAYNSLVRRNLAAQNAFKNIDVQLKRRHDLIPNLINVVKGEMKFEQETLEKVMAARAKAMAVTGSTSERLRAEGELSAVLGRFMALAENYPNLKASEQCKGLMEELAHTENAIGQSRTVYNDVATQYNTALQVIPSNLIAGLCNFRPHTLFEIADPREREVPKVNLDIGNAPTAAAPPAAPPSA